MYVLHGMHNYPQHRHKVLLLFAVVAVESLIRDIIGLMVTKLDNGISSLSSSERCNLFSLSLVAINRGLDVGLVVKRVEEDGSGNGGAGTIRDDVLEAIFLPGGGDSSSNSTPPTTS